MTEEERKAKDAARKREAYARRKQAKAEEQARQASPEIRPVYRDSHKDNAQAILADAEERNCRVELIMANYQKDASNMNKLLWHILETLTQMRLEMVDLIGGLRNGK